MSHSFTLQRVIRIRCLPFIDLDLDFNLEFVTGFGFYNIISAHLGANANGETSQFCGGAGFLRFGFFVYCNLG